ncbi:hypothetical protein ElyMa_004210000 [Elysia marginata]|uniref:Uncharacterized protein n=1 Tax=Elysia marginata TaxID=1093978 RepID=A0AAV4GPV3_9GAST|nr:hypothetical protein ElyMa_004210000 [Elysia marginata]
MSSLRFLPSPCEIDNFLFSHVHVLGVSRTQTFKQNRQSKMLITWFLSTATQRVRVETSRPLIITIFSSGRLLTSPANSPHLVERSTRSPRNTLGLQCPVNRQLTCTSIYSDHLLTHSIKPDPASPPLESALILAITWDNKNRYLP